MGASSVDLGSRPARPGPAVRVALGIVAAAVAAVVVNAVVAAVTMAAGADDDFKPLHASAFGSLTVIGVLLATAGWALVRRTRRAAATLRWLVPVALVVSWVPDLLVGAGGSMPGTTWTGVAGLMVMHVVVAAAVVTMAQRVLPVRDR